LAYLYIKKINTAVIFFKDEYLGVLRRRSQDNTHGLEIINFCNPLSISLVISNLFPSPFLISETKVANGQLRSALKIWAV